MLLASYSLQKQEYMQNLDNINVAELLDRILDHGIVVDPSARIVLLGVDLLSIKGRLVVESDN